MCERFFEAGWIARTGTHRAVKVTEPGKLALAQHLGIT
jgi:hypothetical protein